jgi:VanZ family protein
LGFGVVAEKHRPWLIFATTRWRLPCGPDRVFGSRVSRPVLATLLWTALVLWAGTILWLSSLTPDELPSAAFLVSDKFNHFIAFAAGGWLAASALRVSRVSAPVGRHILVAVALVAAFGALDEMSQLLTPGRAGGDLYDWIADFLGAVAGASLVRLTHGYLERLVPRP